MIPQNLLGTYLALRIAQPAFSSPVVGPHSIEAPAQRVASVDVPQFQTWTTPAEYVYNPDSQQPILVEPAGDMRTERTVYPFDSLPSGDWNNDFIYKNEVQITNNDTSRLWSLPDAFPNLKPLHGGIRAWGPFPQGHNFTIKFSGTANAASWTFGWLVNGRLSAGRYTVVLKQGGRWLAGGGGGWGDDQWTSWGLGRIPADQIDVQITEGIPTGLLLLEYLSWELA